MNVAMKSHRLFHLAAGVLAATALMGSATAQDATTRATPSGAAGSPSEPQPSTSALVNQVLDAPISLSEQDKPLPQVLDAISGPTGVPIRVSEETWSLLPYGRQTPISVTVTDTSLRRTLGAITQKLGLDFNLREDHVEIVALPALQRMGRRALLQEIAMLDLLASIDLNLIEDEPTVGELLQAIDLELDRIDAAATESGAAPFGFKVENNLGEAINQQKLLLPRDITMLQAMEAIHRWTSATWMPWNDTLVVQPKSGWVQGRLDRKFETVRTGISIQQLIQELQQASGVQFRLQPNALSRVPEQYQTLRLHLQNSTVRDTLERLSGYTGLNYDVTDDGIYLWNQFKAPGQDRMLPAGSGGEQPLLLVDLGNSTSLMVYPSDLDQDLRETLLMRRRAAIDELRKQLQEPQSAPTTQPSE